MWLNRCGFLEHFSDSILHLFLCIRYLWIFVTGLPNSLFICLLSFYLNYFYLFYFACGGERTTFRSHFSSCMGFGDKCPLLLSHLAGPNVVIFKQLGGKGAFCCHPGFLWPHTYCMCFSRSLTYLFIFLRMLFVRRKILNVNKVQYIIFFCS